MSDHARRFFKELDEKGEEQVRLHYAAGGYGDGNQHKALVEEWLRQRGDERSGRDESQRQKMQTIAAIAATVAAVAATIGAIASIITLF